jgi:hypothetical protein
MSSSHKVVRIAGSRVAGVAAGVALAGALGAGSASALTPVWAPEAGIVGVDLNHGETTALANSPVPGLLDGFIRAHGSVDLDKSSILPTGHTVVFADFSDIVAEAALAPNGAIGLGLADPARWNGASILVVQALK